jgi:hypothetical protein
VSEEDELPKIMCGDCAYRLDLLSDFRDKAHKTETHLLSKIRGSNVKVEVSFVYLLVQKFTLIFLNSFDRYFCNCFEMILYFKSVEKT